VPYLVGPLVLAQTCSPKMSRDETESMLSSGLVKSSWQLPPGAARAHRPLRTLGTFLGSERTAGYSGKLWETEMKGSARQYSPSSFWPRRVNCSVENTDLDSLQMVSKWIP